MTLEGKRLLPPADDEALLTADLCLGPDGLVYGSTDQSLIFVFDPARRAIIHQQDTEATLGLTCHDHGPRVFVNGSEVRYSCS